MKLIITAWAIIIDKSKILLVLRPNDKKVFPDSWSFPWWKMKPWESLHNTIIREVKEETGLNFTPISKFNFSELITKNFHNISHLYIWTINWNQFDNNSVKWFNIDEIENINIAFNYKKTIKSLLKNLKSL